MMPETNCNGKRPIQLEPFKNFNPSNNHTQLQHQQQLVDNYQDCNPIDPVIKHSSKSHRVGYITNSPLQVAFKNLAPSNGSINCLQQSVKKPLLGLIFSPPNQSNQYQKDQNLQPLLDLLNPNGTNPSPTQRRTTRTPLIQNAFPVPSNNHQVEERSDSQGLQATVIDWISRDIKTLCPSTYSGASALIFLAQNHQHIPELFKYLTQDPSSPQNATLLGLTIDVSLRLRVGREIDKGTPEGVGVGYVADHKVSMPTLNLFMKMTPGSVRPDTQKDFLPVLVSAAKTLFEDEDLDVLAKVVEEISLPLKPGKTSGSEHRAALITKMGKRKCKLAGNAAINLHGLVHLEKLISGFQLTLLKSSILSETKDYVTEAAALLLG
ncbi:hypothetical protein BY996DRAFT_8538059 [Phakopsora pachyrhizi]|nr:hypothetical protein BY996DRAFT_8538059 [Phakopsora pachyrhizi]